MSTVVHKGFSFFMGLCLIYSNTVIAGLIIGQMYEMLRHPEPGALNIMMKKRTIATMARGTKRYILLQQGLSNYLRCGAFCQI